MKTVQDRSGAARPHEESHRRVTTLLVLGASLTSVALTLGLSSGKPLGDSALLIAPGLFLLLALASLLIRDHLRILLLAFPFTFLRTDDKVFWMFAALCGFAYLLRFLSKDLKASGLGSLDLAWLASVPLFGLIGWIHSSSPSETALLFTGSYVFPVFFYLLILKLPADSRFTSRMIRHVLWSFAGVGLLSMLYKLTHMDAERVSGYWQMSYTMMGYSAAALTPLGLFYIYRNPNKIHPKLLFVLLLAANLLTNTRMAIATALLGAILSFRFLRQMKSLVIMIGLLLAYFGADLLFSRLTSTLNAEIDISLAARIVAWNSGFGFLKETPWFGLGLADFQKAYLATTPIPLIELVHAHNLWLNKSVDIGLPGMLLYTGFILKESVRGFRPGQYILGRNVRTSQVLSLCLLLFLLAGITDSVLFSAIWTTWFWMLLALKRRALAEESAGSYNESHSQAPRETGENAT